MNIRTPTDLGLLIRQERRKQGLHQKTLAQKTGVSRQWLIETEKGKPGTPVGLVLRTLNALGVTLRVGSISARGSAGAALPETGVDIDAIVDRARLGPPRHRRTRRR